MSTMFAHVLLHAAAATSGAWPDGIDWPVTATYLALIVGLPALGYLSMLLDVRAYLRSLRRALVVVTGYKLELPEWMRKNTPRCILALGLTMPCTSAEILAAYRRKVKQLHPDRGGDRREFLRLQAQFEEAMDFVESK
jgi:hypothetical protein